MKTCRRVQIFSIIVAIAAIGIINVGCSSSDQVVFENGNISFDQELDMEDFIYVRKIASDMATRKVMRRVYTLAKKYSAAQSLTCQLYLNSEDDYGNPTRRFIATFTLSDLNEVRKYKNERKYAFGSTSEGKNQLILLWKKHLGYWPADD